MKQWTLTAVSLLAGLGACGAQATFRDSEQPSNGAMEVGRFEVCGKPLELEIARNRDDQQRGLMFREGIERGRGMLFIFVPAKRAAMWMRNVPFEIDIGFFDSAGQFMNYHTAAADDPNAPDDDLPLYRSGGRTKYVVETAPGFFADVDLDTCALDPLPSR